jgi:thioesterase domain-containing protein
MKSNTVQLLTQQQQEIEKHISDYLQGLEEYRKKLLLEYELPILSTDVTLFKAQDLWESFAGIDDPYNGWEPFVERTIIVHSIPGTHETMFFDPHVDRLASKIKLGE